MDNVDAVAQQYVDYATSFSKVLVILPKHVVAKGQVKRILKEKKLVDKYTVVNNF